jgi:hypothetical protein
VTEPELATAAEHSACWSVRDLAARLGVNERTVWRWLADGIGPPSHWHGRRRFFQADAVETWTHRTAPD